MEDPAVPIPKLPNDVIVEILTRLPVKPLLKFKCVCKSWRTLISSRKFVTSHLQNSESDPNSTSDRLIMWCKGNFKQCPVNSVLCEAVSEPFDLSCPVQSERVRVVGSCNGLVCLDIERKDLILWNPSTRIWKKLPDVQEKLSNRLDYGFGFDESNDDYKVVGFFDNIEDESDDYVIVKVYSLRNDEWKRINNFARDYWVLGGYARLVNEKLYWVAGEELYEGGFSWVIVCFDLEKEEAEIQQLPSCLQKSDLQNCSISEVGAYGGSPFVICWRQASSVVWIMNECSVGDNGNWTKLVTIPFADDDRKDVDPVYVKNGQFLLFCSMSPRIMIFDAKDCSISYPDVRTNFRHLQSSYNGEWFQLHTYRESLVSPLG